MATCLFGCISAILSSIRAQIPDIGGQGPFGPPWLASASCSRNTCMASCHVAEGGTGRCYVLRPESHHN